MSNWGKPEEFPALQRVLDVELFGESKAERSRRVETFTPPARLKRGWSLPNCPAVAFLAGGQLTAQQPDDPSTNTERRQRQTMAVPVLRNGRLLCSQQSRNSGGFHVEENDLERFPCFQIC